MPAEMPLPVGIPAPYQAPPYERGVEDTVSWEDEQRVLPKRLEEEGE